jgi:RNA polymerase sigma-70 factor (ECF subfamily)
MSQGGVSEETPRRNDELFVHLLVSEQLKLQNYITMLLTDTDAATNVLQETNLVLWRKASDFTPGTSFTAWSRKVAYWQVQAFIRDRARDRHCFSKELVDQLAHQKNKEPEESETQVALRHCMNAVSSSNREFLRLRYEDGLTIAGIADRLHKEVAAVKMRLMRIRQSLQKCIEEKLSETT